MVDKNYEVIPDITTPIDQEVANFIQRIIDADDTFATLTESVFIDYDYEPENIYIYTRYPQYLTVINHQLFKDLCDMINEYYGFTVYVKKIDSILHIKPKKN